MDTIERIRDKPACWQKEDMQAMCSAVENTLPTPALESAFALSPGGRTADEEEMVRAHTEAQDAIYEECQTTGQKYMLWATMIAHHIERCVEVGAWDAEAAEALFARDG